MELNDRRGSRMLTDIMKTRVCPHILALVVAAIGLARAAAFACPACNAMIAERASQVNPPLAAGLYWSILVLLSVPFVLVGVVAWAIVRAVHRHQAAPTACVTQAIRG